MEDVFRLNRPCGGKTYKQFMTADLYPAQNTSYLGRTITVRFKDENDASGIIHERNDIYDNMKPVFKILRWDLDNEGKAIMVNKRNQVIVANIAEIKEHRWYKRYDYDDLVFMLPDDIRAQMTEEEYNAQLDLYEELLTSVLAKGPYTGVYPTTELEDIIPDMPDNILSYDEAWEVTA